MPRVDKWNFDGRLNRSDQCGNELYLHNALDRGHMVRREDPVWGDTTTASRANRDTFTTPIAARRWRESIKTFGSALKNYVLSHTKEDKMRVSVFTGPFFTDDDPMYRDVAVPQAFWKVIAFLLDDGRLSATAYKVSQVQELKDLEFIFAAYKTFQISIKQVADETALISARLIPLDGFSTHELATGERLEERLEDLSQIRV